VPREKVPNPESGCINRPHALPPSAVGRPSVSWAARWQRIYSRRRALGWWKATKRSGSRRSRNAHSEARRQPGNPANTAMQLKFDANQGCQAAAGKRLRPQVGNGIERELLCRWVPVPGPNSGLCAFVHSTDQGGCLRQSQVLQTDRFAVRPCRVPAISLAPRPAPPCDWGRGAKCASNR